MTTKSNYAAFILHSFTTIILSNPSHELLETINDLMCEFERQICPEGRGNIVISISDDYISATSTAAFTNFLDDGYDDKSQDDADWGDVVEDEGQDMDSNRE